MKSLKYAWLKSLARGKPVTVRAEDTRNCELFYVQMGGLIGDIGFL